MSTVHSTRTAVQYATINARAPFSVISHGHDAELRSEHAAMQSMASYVSGVEAERAAWARVLARPTTTRQPVAKRRSVLSRLFGF